MYVKPDDLELHNIPTFESHWTDHEGCPHLLVFYSDSIGWCTLHDEWWELPTQEEILGIV